MKSGCHTDWSQAPALMIIICDVGAEDDVFDHVIRSQVTLWSCILK